MAKMTFSETDNQKEVYNIAKLLMDAVPITLNERIPVFCSHPFTDFIYTPQINNNKIDKTWNLTNPEDFEEWRTAILQRLEQSEIRNMFYITSKAYRLTFLKYAQPYLTKQTFSELFGDIWVTSENPNDDVYPGPLIWKKQHGLHIDLIKTPKWAIYKRRLCQKKIC